MTADRSVLDREGPLPLRTLAYGPADHQVYELHAPTGEARALLVLVHGGFWRAPWDRTHLRPLAGALVEQGYAVALVEYVRSGMPGGGWPGTGQDVRAALRAVLDGEAGARPVVLVGHSAGGHLAVWALHQPELRSAPALRGAVSLAGCLDLRLVHELGLDGGAALALMGEEPGTDPAAWAGADPARLGRTAYPVVAVHGEQDEWVPAAVSRSWWQRAGTPGRDRLVLRPEDSHFTLIDPGAAGFPALVAQIEGLLGAA